MLINEVSFFKGQKAYKLGIQDGKSVLFIGMSSFLGCPDSSAVTIGFLEKCCFSVIFSAMVI